MVLWPKNKKIKQHPGQRCIFLLVKKLYEHASLGNMVLFKWHRGPKWDSGRAPACSLGNLLKIENCMGRRGCFSSGSTAKNPLAMQETWVQSLGWEDPPEEDLATHSSVLAWRIPWTEEPGGLQYMRSQRIGHDWSDVAQHLGRDGETHSWWKCACVCVCVLKCVCVDWLHRPPSWEAEGETRPALTSSEEHPGEELPGRGARP